MKRNNPGDIVYIVRGIIWFGNKYFLEEISFSHKKEKEVKEKFLQELKIRTENLGSVKFESFSLLLNKYVPIIEAEIKDKDKKGKHIFTLNGESIGGASKKYFLEGFIEGFKSNRDSLKKIKDIIDSKNYIVKKNLIKQGYIKVIDKLFTTQSRLVVGLGSSHVFETALTLHHIYGVPYIPGSTLKGVCRAVAFWELAEKKNILNDESEIEKLYKKFYGKLVEDDNDILTYQLLFGAQDFRGLLLFLDAYPIIEENTDIFELDIMNVHYPSYYGEKKPPGDWENPVPIYFLTVKPGVKFNICILFDEFRWKSLKDSGNIQNVVIKEVEKLISQNNFLEEILKIALNQFGVGAKGRLGYGILG